MQGSLHLSDACWFFFPFLPPSMPALTFFSLPDFLPPTSDSSSHVDELGISYLLAAVAARCRLSLGGGFVGESRQERHVLIARQQRRQGMASDTHTVLLIRYPVCLHPHSMFVSYRLSAFTRPASAQLRSPTHPDSHGLVPALLVRRPLSAHDAQTSSWYRLPSMSASTSLRPSATGLPWACMRTRTLQAHL